jgi:uncharacterized protein YbaP (TraB family)
MKTPFITLLFLSLLQTACNAQPQQSKSTQENDGKSLLWRVEKSGQKTSWLFGTMHMICKEDYVWTPAMEKALEQSKTVCFEMDMDDPAVMMQVAMGLIDNSGKKLRDHFTPEQYARLEQYVADSLQGNLAMFERMKPFALQSLFITKGGLCDSLLSYESELMKRAQQDKKEVTGLETPDQQLAVINNIPPDSVVVAIMRMIENPGEHSEEYRKMTAFYQAQDLEGLRQMIGEARGMEGVMTIFLDDRNRQWVGAMEKMMATDAVFFAVGAGHLGGEHGVITLLREKGYTVTQVN